jgi:hypothetical protein
MRENKMKFLTGIIIFCISTYSIQALPAFPGAEGYGSTTIGGRGGRVIEVTNVLDAGPGSLRQALAVETGPRIVVFRTGGTIALSSNIEIKEANSFVTVAGQTSPGGGIQIKNYSIELRDGVHDVVLRYLKGRCGTSGGEQHGLSIWGNNGKKVYNVVVDHCSFEWGVDENVGGSGWFEDFTIQWCLIAEASMTGHSKGQHSMGMLLAGDTDPRVTTSVHHCVFAHNYDRNPLIRGNTSDFRNNLVYNWGTGGSAQFAGAVKMNVVNNQYIKGPSGLTKDKWAWFTDQAKGYLSGNLTPQYPNGTTNDWESGVYLGSSATGTDPNPYKATIPFAVPPVTTHPATSLKDLLLPQVGAILPKRDTVDARIISDVMAGTGQDGIGSDYPVLAAGTPPADADHDGMPDAWENGKGLSANDVTDAIKDRDSDGYTNLEEFINFPGLRDATPPNVAITAPNGGEKWPVNSKRNITWNDTDFVGVTFISLFWRTPAISWTKIDSVSANNGNGSYLWRVPSQAAAAAWIKVNAYDAQGNKGSDTSDIPFSIVNTPAFTSLDSVFVLKGGNLNYAITWNNSINGSAVYTALGNPGWMNIVGGTNISGTAPNVTRVDTFNVLLSVGGIAYDTLKLRVFIGAPQSILSRANIQKVFDLTIQNQKLIASIDQPGILKFKVYDIQGAQVMNINRAVDAGDYAIPCNLKAGIYLIKLEHEGREAMKRFLIIR